MKKKKWTGGINEPHREKTGFLPRRKQRRRFTAIVFATRIVQFLFRIFLNPKFQASSMLLEVYRPICVGPGRKPRRPVFSRRGSAHIIVHHEFSEKHVLQRAHCEAIISVFHTAYHRLILGVLKP